MSGTIFSCVVLTSFSSDDSSYHTSNDAVLDEPRRRWKGGNSHFCETPLPPSISPASAAQKWLLREVGKLGPLTYIQQVQLYVHDLNAYPISIAESNATLDADFSEYQPTAESRLRRDRLARISRWRTDLLDDNTWDRVARREFAEAALARRAMYGTNRQ